MRIALITIFPEMLKALDLGMPGQAQKKGLLELRAFHLREFAEDLNRTVDDRPYGGGPGMLLMPGPLKHAILAAKAWAGEAAKVIYLSPQGKVFKQAYAQEMAKEQALIFIAGRYEGIDERIIDLYVDEEWSIGDYVLSGGELPALVMIDALMRWIPGALGNELSNHEDSFTHGLLDCPHYTRPEMFEGLQVPQVLLSGHHAEITKWRKKESVARTKKRRPDLMSDTGEQDE